MERKKPEGERKRGKGNSSAPEFEGKLGCRNVEIDLLNLHFSFDLRFLFGANVLSSAAEFPGGLT